jgi:hypothetical protein
MTSRRAVDLDRWALLAAHEAVARHPWAVAALDWDRATRQPGKRGGIIGRRPMAVYHVLLAYRLKRIEPTRTVIAAAAAIDPSTVVTAIRRLCELGMVALSRQGGRPILQPPQRWRRDAGPVLDRRQASEYSIR